MPTCDALGRPPAHHLRAVAVRVGDERGRPIGSPQVRRPADRGAARREHTAGGGQQGAQCQPAHVAASTPRADVLGWPISTSITSVSFLLALSSRAGACWRRRSRVSHHRSPSRGGSRALEQLLALTNEWMPLSISVRPGTATPLQAVSNWYPADAPQLWMCDELFDFPGRSGGI